MPWPNTPSPQRPPYEQLQWGPLLGFLLCLVAGAASLYGLYCFIEFIERIF